MIRWATIILSVAGLCVGVWAVVLGNDKPPQIPLARPPSVNPYASGVASLGIVEPAGKNVSIVAPEAALVMEVFADVNDHVEAGTPLFKLDGRRLEADLIRARAAVIGGEAEIARWHALPRAEDLPQLAAAVERARAVMQDRDEQLRLITEARGRGAGTDRNISQATFDAAAAKADFDAAVAAHDRLMAGGWQPDLAVSQARLALLKAEVEALQVLVDRLTVRAPREGTVLRRQIEPGEYASTDSLRPAFVIGDLRQLHIRAQVDEEDIALIGHSPRAIARTRGAIMSDIPLELVRIEPFARPKSDLSGSNIERVDTRVIDVVFRVVTLPDSPIFPGQAVDVFVEGMPRGGG